MLPSAQVGDWRRGWCLVAILWSWSLIPSVPTGFRALDRFAPHLRHDPAARRYLRCFNTDIYGWLAPLGPGDKATLDGVYDAEVASQDEQVGQFVARLQATGQLERTLLIVCADHGDHLGEKQLVGHSFGAYNEVVRVPLIIHDQGGDFPAGATRDTPVSLRRVFHAS